MTAAEIRPARDDAEVAAALALRHEVFVVEQGVPPAEEQDARDADALHLVAVAGGRVVATCRLVRDGETVKLGRLAVAAGARGRGLASARVDGVRRIALAAQTGALGLYARAGYTARGERFLDAGIEHLMMEKGLA